MAAAATPHKVPKLSHRFGIFAMILFGCMVDHSVLSWIQSKEAISFAAQSQLLGLLRMLMA